MNLTTKAQALLLGLCALTASTTTSQAQAVDLVTGNSGRIGAALFQFTDTQPTGTGFIDPFVRIQAKGVEEGYNTSGRPFPFDEKPPLNWTHDVQVKDLGAGTNINGVIYYQFLLDINEPGNEKAIISLDEIRVYTSTTASQTTLNLSELGTLRYSTGSSGYIMLDSSRNGGSGSGDMYMFLPKSLFAGVPSTHYFILYSRFGSREPAKSDDSEAGFEEWAIIAHPEPECPELVATGGAINSEEGSVRLIAEVTGSSSAPISEPSPERTRALDLKDRLDAFNNEDGGDRDPFTIGYWKNHPEHLTEVLKAGNINLGDTVVSSASQAFTILSGANASDARDMLRAQLLASMLNVANNANPTLTGEDIRTVISQAVSFLSGNSQPLPEPPTAGSFRWTGPNGFTSTQQNPTVTAPGTYTVTQTFNSCQVTASAVASDSRVAFTVTARGGELTCSKSSVQLLATCSQPGVTFKWSGPGILSGGTTATPTVGQAGVYTVVATDGASRSQASATATVTETGTFSLTARGGLLDCDTRTMQLLATSSLAGVTFTWTGPGIVSGGSTATPVVNQPGAYQVVARSSTGCESVASATVTDVSKTFTITPRGGALTCDRPMLQLSVSSITTGLSYSWSGPGIVSGGTTATPIVSAPGAYTVTATDRVSGCKATAVATVVDSRKTFTISAVGGQLTCDRQMVQLSASSDLVGVSYTWSGPSIISGGNTATPTVSQPGTYTVIAKDMASGCTATSTATVTDTARSFTMTARGGQLTCDITSVQLQATASVGGVNFTWTGPGIVSGANTATPTVNQAGAYQVTASDGSGCDAVASVMVTDVRKAFTIAATGGTITCDRPTARLAVTSTLAGVTYQWTGPGIVSGGTTANPVVNASGTYTVVAKDMASGCTAIATAVVTQTQATFTLAVQGATLDCIDTEVTLRAFTSAQGATFRWSGPGILSGGDTGNVLVNMPGTYTVTATVNGCSVSSVSRVGAVNTSVDAVPMTAPPAEIMFKAHTAYPSATFEVELENVPPGYTVGNGRYIGWCIEEDDALMTGVFWPATLHPVNNAPDGWKTYDWRRVNYILNHAFTGTSEDVQKAIWHFVGASTTVPNVLTAAAQAIVTEAIENSDCFTPIPGDTMGVMIRPANMTQQTVLIEVPVLQAAALPSVTVRATLDASGGINLALSGGAGKTIVLESSSDLKTWSHVQTFTSTSGTLNVALPNDRTVKSKFYRAQVQ